MYVRLTWEDPFSPDSLSFTRAPGQAAGFPGAPSDRSLKVAWDSEDDARGWESGTTSGSVTNMPCNLSLVASWLCVLVAPSVK